MFSKRAGELTARDIVAQGLVAFLVTFLVSLLIGRGVSSALGVAAFVAAAMTGITYATNSRAKQREPR